MAEFGFFAGALLMPDLAVGIGAVNDALFTGGARLFLVALELLHGREKRVALAVPEPEMAAPACLDRFKGEPGFQVLAIAFGRAVHANVGKPGVGQCRLQHFLDAGAAFNGADVPGECHEIAPVAFGGKEHGDRRCVIFLCGAFEFCKPALYNEVIRLFCHAVPPALMRLSAANEPAGPRPDAVLSGE